MKIRTYYLHWVKMIARIRLGSCLVLLAFTVRAEEPRPAGSVRVFGTDRFLTFASPITFSADDNSIIGFTSDSILCRWNASDGRLLKRLRLPGSGAPYRAISSDGGLAAFPGEPRERMVIWDVTADKLLRHLTIEPPWSYHDVVVVLGGKRIVTAEHNTRENNKGIVRLWSLDNGSCQIVGEEAHLFQSLTTSPNGKLFAASSNWPNQVTRCWSAQTGKELWSVKHAAARLIFANEGKTLIAMPFQFERQWRAWDVATGKRAEEVCLPTMEVSSADSITLGAIDSTLVLAMPQAMVLWDLATGKEIRRFDPAQSLGAIDHAGMTLLTLKPRWQRWKIATGERLYPDSRTFGNQAIDRLCFSPNGRTIASVGGNSLLCLCDTLSGEVIRLETSEALAFLYGLAFTRDCKHLVCAHWAGSVGGFVLIRDLPSGKVVRRIAVAGVPTSVAITPCGTRVVVTAQKVKASATEKDLSSFVTFELSTGREIPPSRIFESKSFADISRDGRVAVANGVLFDCIRGEFRHRVVSEKELYWLSGPNALSHDGRYYAVHALLNSPGPPSEYCVVVVEVASARQVAVLKTAALGRIAFTPDNRRVVTADWDGIRVWDIASKKCERHHAAHDVWDFYSHSMIDLPKYREKVHQSNGTFATSLSISPDGRLAATGHPDTRVILWDVTPPHLKESTATLKDSAWDDLASLDAARAFGAVQALIAHPQHALRLIRERLRPINAPAPAQLQALIEQLDDPSYQIRETAQKRLLEFGPVVLPQIREAIRARPTAEQRRRLAAVETELGNPLPLKSDELRAVRACEVLERIGNSNSCLLLESIAKGEEFASSTHEARAALARLGGPPSGR